MNDDPVSRDAYRHLQHELDGALRDGVEASKKVRELELQVQDLQKKLCHALCDCGPAWTPDPSSHREGCKYLGAVEKRVEPAPKHDVCRCALVNAGSGGYCPLHK